MSCSSTESLQPEISHCDSPQQTIAIHFPASDHRHRLPTAKNPGSCSRCEGLPARFNWKTISLRILNNVEAWLRVRIVCRIDRKFAVQAIPSCLSLARFVSPLAAVLGGFHRPARHRPIGDKIANNSPANRNHVTEHFISPTWALGRRLDDCRELLWQAPSFVERSRQRLVIPNGAAIARS
jgi:hypothetical protein